MVASDDLLDRVHGHRAQHLQPVLHSPARTRQVHDQAAADHPRHAARQHRGRDAVGDAVRPDRLGDARDLEVQQRPGDLRRAVGRCQAGAAGGEHHAGAAVGCGRDRRADRLAVGYDDGGLDHEAELGQEVHDQGAGRVVVHAGGRAVGRDDHLGPQTAHRAQSPDLPPVLVSTRTSVITAPLSTALTMSMTVSAATETAVSASISTPVRSLVRTVALISTASSVTARSTVTPEIASGWQSGISAGVCLAPMIPAIRATASASPFGTPSPRSSATTSDDTRTRPDALASRAVTDLAETSTIRAAPDSSTWVRRPGDADGSDIRTPRRASTP